MKVLKKKQNKKSKKKVKRNQASKAKPHEEEPLNVEVEEQPDIESD